MDCKHGRPQEGGKSRPSPPPLENKLKVFWLYWGPFHHMVAFLLLFTSWWGPFFGLAPPPTKISADAHDCKEGSRACSPKKFFGDRNLVSSGHVLLRFCLKNDKNNDKL